MEGKMTSSLLDIGLKALDRLGCCLLVLVLLLSFSPLASQGAAASQEVTLTLTSSSLSGHSHLYLLNVTASAPVTGPIMLYWTINGNGPFQNTTQITNGLYERTFGCQNPGNWTLWFVWEGDDQYSHSQSNSVTVLGDPEGPPLEVPGSDYDVYLVAAGAGIAALVGIVLVLLWSRGRKK